MSLRYGKSTGFLESYGEAGTFRRDTATCQHCCFVIVVEPYCDPADFGGLCRQCMGIICPRCVKKAKCIPTEKMIEQMEAAGAERTKLAEWEKTPIIAIGT
jgi:hypothetical protein